MYRRRRFRRTITDFRSFFCAMLFLPLGLIGCGDSCFVFVSNPGGGTISNAPSCSVKPANGTVRVRMTSSITGTNYSPTGIQHIFVTLRGVEANPSATAGDESAGWQELTPKLATEPLQLDLLGRKSGSCEQNAFDSVKVPADQYRQIRLRLSSNPPDSEPIPEENFCGNVGPNCAVTSDGVISPLVLDSGVPQIRIGSERISGSFFRVLPDSDADLNIEFNLQSSMLNAAGEIVHLAPVFTVDSQTSCESVAA